MATLAADTPRAWATNEIESYPVIASDVIYEGAMVGENGSGFARPLVAGDKFLGFALRKADNSGGVAGDVRVEVRTRGAVQIAVSGLAVTANDRPLAYASDDDTVTLTSTANSLIGSVSRYVSAGVGVVEFNAAP